MSADKSATATAPVPKKFNKKLALIVAGALLLGGAGTAGATWLLIKRGFGADMIAKKEGPKKPLFTPLEPFTVNLMDPRGERYAQIGITLQLEDPEIEIQLKDRLPAVRNQILMLITAKTIDERLTPEGKQLLADQVRARAAQTIGFEVPDPLPRQSAAAAAAPVAPVVIAANTLKKQPLKADKAIDNPVKDVLFSQFIVQ